VGTKRTFNVLELCCFPEGCLISEEEQPLLATVLVPRLEAAGMKTIEWTRGALMLEEPHFSKVRSIVCKPCNTVECPINPRFKPNDGLSDLMDGLYAERIEKGEAVLAQLLPEARKAELEQAGIRCFAGQMPSRKNPRLWFTFKRGDRTQRVACEVGKRRLLTNEGEQPLLSLEQLSRKIKEAAQALI